MSASRASTSWRRRFTHPVAGIAQRCGVLVGRIADHQRHAALRLGRSRGRENRATTPARTANRFNIAAPVRAPCVPVGGSGPRKHQPPDEQLILRRRRGQMRSVPTMRPQITSLLKHAVPTCDDEGHTLRHHSGDESNVARKPVQLRDQDAAFHSLGGGEGGSANRQSRPARDRWAVETVAREAINGSIAEAMVEMAATAIAPR